MGVDSATDSLLVASSTVQEGFVVGIASSIAVVALQYFVLYMRMLRAGSRFTGRWDMYVLGEDSRCPQCFNVRPLAKCGACEQRVYRGLKEHLQPDPCHCVVTVKRTWLLSTMLHLVARHDSGSDRERLRWEGEVELDTSSPREAVLPWEYTSPPGINRGVYSLVSHSSGDILMFPRLPMTEGDRAVYLLRRAVA